MSVPLPGDPPDLSGLAMGDAARRTLDRRVLEWIAEPWGDPDEARFDALARELFCFQCARVPGWARFCASRGVTPETVGSWREIPPVPTGAFKELALRAFPAEATRKTFLTSGTSGAGEARGALHLDSLALYEASLRASFERFVLPDLAPGARLPMFVLAPSPAEAPDSSLSHMFGVMLAARGAPGSGFFLRNGALASPELLAALASLESTRGGALVCGTAFAFVHLLEGLGAAGRKLALPEGTRLMETGGFKGRARAMPRESLYAALGDALGVPAARIINQYGMTELGSQFYDSLLRDPGEPRRKIAPPWTRVRVLDPETGRECAPGEGGSLAITDLANTGSVCAVWTADRGRVVDGGFEVQGRLPGAEARGCSLAADAMLGRG